MIAQILAQAVATQGLSPQVVGTIIGAIIIALIGGGVLGKKTGRVEGKAEGIRETQMVGPQPFIVQLREEFATVRQVEKLEAKLEVVTTEMKGLFERTMDSVKASNDGLGKKMERSNERLSTKIESIASADANGRRLLWTKVNSSGEEIIALKANNNVGEGLTNLAAALNPSSPKIQPVHITPSSHQ